MGARDSMPLQGEAGVRALGVVTGNHLLALIDSGLWAVDFAGAHANEVGADQAQNDRPLFESCWMCLCQISCGCAHF